MKISQLSLVPWSLPCVRPFYSARGVHKERSGCYIRARSENHLGLGEAAPLPDLSSESLDDVQKAFRSIESLLLGAEVPETPDALSAFLKTLRIPPSLLFAVETALCTIAAKEQKKQIAAWLNPRFQTEIAFNRVLACPPGQIKELLQQATPLQGQPLKIKLVSSPEEIVSLLQMIRRDHGNDFPIRIDANGSLDFQTAAAFLRQLDGLNIEYIEDPLFDHSPEQIQRLKELSDIKVAIDNDLADPERLEEHLSCGVADVLVLKPTILGGGLRCFEIIERARANNQAAVFTSCLESPVGIAACLQIHSASPHKLPAAGFDTLETYGILSFPRKQGPQMILPDGPGLGSWIENQYVKHSKGS